MAMAKRSGHMFCCIYVKSFIWLLCRFVYPVQLLVFPKQAADGATKNKKMGPSDVALTNRVKAQTAPTERVSQSFVFVFCFCSPFQLLYLAGGLEIFSVVRGSSSSLLARVSGSGW